MLPRKSARVAPSPVPIPVVFVKRKFYADSGGWAASMLSKHGTLYVCTQAPDALQLAAIRHAFGLCQPNIAPKRTRKRKGGDHA